MRVLEPEAGEQDLGVAVGPVVMIAVGIEQEVRRLADEHAAVPDRQRGGQVEPLGEHLDRIGAAVAVGVLEDLDPVGARVRGAAARGPGRTRSGGTGPPSPA